MGGRSGRRSRSSQAATLSTRCSSSLASDRSAFAFDRSSRCGSIASKARSAVNPGRDPEPPLERPAEVRRSVESELAGDLLDRDLVVREHLARPRLQEFARDLLVARAEKPETADHRPRRDVELGREVLERRQRPTACGALETATEAAPNLAEYLPFARRRRGGFALLQSVGPTGLDVAEVWRERHAFGITSALEGASKRTSGLK